MRLVLMAGIPSTGADLFPGFISATLTPPESVSTVAEIRSQTGKGVAFTNYQ